MERLEGGNKVALKKNYTPGMVGYVGRAYGPWLYANAYVAIS